MNRDIVVVGSSAGGVEALPRLLGLLPPDLPASVFVCQHQARSNDPQLATILKRTATMEVRWAEQGDRIERGNVYVAPPDVHLTVAEEHMQLTRGPRENYARPSIDRLFRSAAATHAGRTIAVILTGMMEDGVAGALAIMRAGGRVIVQDPHDAAFPELPTRALAAMTPDATLPVERIANALVEMTREVAPLTTVPEDLLLEHELDQRPMASLGELDQLGERSTLHCPDCNGALWALGPATVPRWRCYLGHVTGAADVLSRNQEEVEAALWCAVRALQERAMTLERLARDASTIAAERIAAEYTTRAAETRQQAELARQFMLDLLKRTR